MRYSNLFLCLFLFSCGGQRLPPYDPPDSYPAPEEPPPIPRPPLVDQSVDMVFRATITQTEDTCGVRPPPPGVTTVIDVFLRANGKINIKNLGPYFGLGDYEDVVLKFNQVNHRWYEIPANSEFVVEHLVAGFITMEKIGLDLNIRTGYAASTDSSGRPRYYCHRKYRLAGPARPIFDSMALDGFYKAHVEYYGKMCPGDARKIQTEATGLFEVNHYKEGAALYILNYKLSFDAPLPSTDGVFEWSGPMDLKAYGAAYKFDGKVSGQLNPFQIYLWIEYALVDDTSNCYYSFLVWGMKQAPMLTRIENEYRAVFDITDNCFGLQSDEGSVYLIEPFGDLYGTVFVADKYLGFYALPGPDGVFEYTEGAEDWGWVMTASGKMIPPFLAYNVSYRKKLASGLWCAGNYSVSGHVRYVFE